jgi:hypothetical protein
MRFDDQLGLECSKYTNSNHFNIQSDTSIFAFFFHHRLNVFGKHNAFFAETAASEKHFQQNNNSHENRLILIGYNRSFYSHCTFGHNRHFGAGIVFRLSCTEPFFWLSYAPFTRTVISDACRSSRRAIANKRITATTPRLMCYYMLKWII